MFLINFQICRLAQILIEFKTTRPAATSFTEIWNATIAFSSGAPRLVAEPLVKFEAIGGNPISIPLTIGRLAFQTNQIDPFSAESAPLAFALSQWSAFLSASVATLPIIQTAVCFLVQITCLIFLLIASKRIVIQIFF